MGFDGMLLFYINYHTMLQTGKSIETVKDYQRSFNDMRKNRHGTMFVMASKNKTSNLFNVDDLSMYKVYVTERPVNNATTLSPIYNYVSLLHRFFFVFNPEIGYMIT